MKLKDGREQGDYNTNQVYAKVFKKQEICYKAMPYNYFKCAGCGQVKRTGRLAKKTICCGKYQSTPATRGAYVDYKLEKKAVLSSTATQPATTAAAGQATAQPAPLFDDKAGEKPATVAAKEPLEQVGTTNSTPINLEPEFKKAKEKITVSEAEKERAYQCGACGGSTKSRDRCDSCGVAFQ